MLFRPGQWMRVLLALLPLPLVTVAVAVAGDGGAEPASPGPVAVSSGPAVPEPELREALLAAYERSRRATWMVTFDFSRRLRNGASLDYRVTKLNRPPDHLNVGLGGRSGRMGGRSIVCSEVDGRELCAPQGPVTPFEEEVAAEISEFRDVLQPPAKWYAVEDGGERRVAGEAARCFRLRLVVDIGAPPYGERAERCYATAGGAPLLDRVERAEGTDQHIAREVTFQVSDGDIADLLGPA